MSRSSVLTRLRLLPAACAVLGLLVAGCGSSHPRSAAPATTTTTTDPRATAVLSAYRAGWAAFEQALQHADPALPALAQTMAGAELDFVKRQLVADQVNGIVGRGGIQLNPKLLSIGGDQAVVVDCAFDSSELIYTATGKPVPPLSPPEKVAVRAQLSEVTPGVWKVVDQHTAGGSCPSNY